MNLPPHPSHRILGWPGYACLILSLMAMTGAAAPANRPIELSARGRELQARYEQVMQELRAELMTSLPSLEEEKKNAFSKARREAHTAAQQLSATENKLQEISKAKGLVEHARNKWIKEAKNHLRSATLKLEKAIDPAQREAANTELAKAQEDLAAGEEALRTRLAHYEQLQPQEADLKQRREVEARVLEERDKAMYEAAAACNLARLLGSPTYDGKLAKFSLLKQASPHGLAAFAEQGPQEEQWIEELLTDYPLMTRMWVAGGAKEGRYGEAIKIYRRILQASPRAGEPGILQNLGLGIALEMATPYRQAYSTYLSRDLPPVDPVSRYLHYEKAYLSGELDPAFKDMSTWECRWIACDPSSNDDLSWIRAMVKTYRPDLMRHPDLKWFYTGIVREAMAYRRPQWGSSLPITKLQEALDKGGICHTRAWMARSSARAFGIPARRVEEGGAKPPLPLPNP